MDKDKKEQVVAYGGRSMNSSERKWGITDKKGLALVLSRREYEMPFTPDEERQHFSTSI